MTSVSGLALRGFIFPNGRSWFWDIWARVPKRGPKSRDVPQRPSIPAALISVLSESFSVFSQNSKASQALIRLAFVSGAPSLT